MSSPSKIIRALCALSVTIMLAACTFASAPPPPPPAASAAPTFAMAGLPTASPSGDSAVILIPYYLNQTGYTVVDFSGTVERVNSMLKKQGLSVTIELKESTLDNMGYSGYLSKARESLASGSPQADAYALDPFNSRALFDKGLTMDVKALLTQVAPAFTTKYGSLFDDPLTGVPLNLSTKPRWYKQALLVRQDCREYFANIHSLDDLFVLLGSDDADLTRPVRADPGDLLIEWVMEQGYCPLSLISNGGFLCASDTGQGDALTPIENLAGFRNFVTVMMQCYTKGTLTASGRAADPSVTAYVGNLISYNSSSPASWLSTDQGDYSAQLLSPGTPGFFYDPTADDDLVIPKNCPKAKAEDVIRFADWYNLSQSNYDALNYGEDGKDYTVSERGLIPLKDGKPLQPTQARGLGGIFCACPGASLFRNTDYYRMPAGAPANVTQLVEAGIQENKRLALNRSIPANYNTAQAMQRISDDADSVLSARSNILYGLLYCEPSEYSRQAFDQAMDTLGKLNVNTLIYEYQRVLSQLERR